MEEIIQNHISWFKFISISLLLIIFQQVLVFFSRYLRDFWILGKTRIPLTDLSQKGLVILEPVIYVCILGLFIAINPIIHAIVVVIIGALLFQQLRDYHSGRIILYSSTILRDKNIIVGKYSGSVVKMGKLGLHIRTPEGVSYLNYSRIISEGFTLSAGKELGEYCHVLVRAKSTDTTFPELKRKLNEILVTLPYIDWKYKPKISGSCQIEGELELKMLLHENVESEEVCRFLTEAGYHCVVKII